LFLVPAVFVVLERARSGRAPEPGVRAPTDRPVAGEYEPQLPTHATASLEAS